jgi:hypothetical protein
MRRRPGRRVEEGTGLDSAAAQDACGFEYRLSAGDNGFQVVQHAAGVRRVLQDGAEKQTFAATDIDDAHDPSRWKLCG